MVEMCSRLTGQKERPIVMSAPMVRAILSGLKTQTRRVLRKGTWWSDAHGVIRMAPAAFGCTGVAQVDCPYGKGGDRLWVKESYGWHVHAMGASRNEDGPFVYAADGSAQHRLCEKWRSSMFMPRYASRMLLEVSGVRVEPLQAITDADAIAEGVAELVPMARRAMGLDAAALAGAALATALEMPKQTRRRFLTGAVAAAAGIGASAKAPAEPLIDTGVQPTPKDLYAVLWESIHGVGSWSHNPHVWVLDFRRVS